ncbi:MAG: hypothetical protein E5X65_24795 [Mesorhizobium sp.]|nr:MAG: hypothetical protein E5X65_24795 [Mesorhizobium sp.]
MTAKANRPPADGGTAAQESNADDLFARRYEANRTGKLKLGKCVLSEKQRNGSTCRFSLELLRLREIEKIIHHRHGRFIPETDDGDIYIEAAAFARCGQDMREWCHRWAPWMADDLDEVISAIERRASRLKHMQGADAVATMLLVTMAERTALDLHTVGACDVSKKGRDKLAKNRKREQDRTRREQKRKAAGAKNRVSYEAESDAQIRPWEAMNMSRRTWYRKGKPERGTGPSRVVSYDRIGDQPVPTVAEMAAVPSRPSFTIEKANISGVPPRPDDVMLPQGSGGARGASGLPTLGDIKICSSARKAR